MGAIPGSMNTAFLIAMFDGVHSTTYTMLVMRKLSRHCVLTGIDVGGRFVMGPYWSLCNALGMMWVNRTQQTAWFYLAQIQFTCLDIAGGSEYQHWHVMYGLRDNYFRQTTIMS